MPISVLVADDHQMVVGAMRAAFAPIDDIRIVGDTQDGADVVRLVDELRPDVLVLDLTMPGCDGLEVLRRLRAAGRRVAVVILSMHTTAAYAAGALKLGALGYVGKSAPTSELVAAIRAVAVGQRYLAPPLTSEQLIEYEHRLDAHRLDPFDTLSNREREIMRATALGHTSRAIAGELGISRRTVETHLQNSMRKLGVKTRSELVRYAVRVGLVSAER